MYTGVLNRMLQLGVFYAFTTCVHPFFIESVQFLQWFIFVYFLYI